MNHKALKWAAIGAGAWLLYRYLAKPTQAQAEANAKAEIQKKRDEAPWWRPVNKDGGYDYGI